MSVFSEEKFLRYLGLIDSVIYVVEIKGDSYSPKWVSPNIERILGYTVDEALAPNWWYDHIHPDDRREVERRQTRLFKYHSLQHKYRLRKKDGGYIWVLDKLGFYPDDEGEGGELVGSITDITSEVDLEERARESEERFRLAFHTNPDAVNVSRLPDGLIIDVNEGFCRTFGFSRDEILGRTSLGLNLWADRSVRDELLFRLEERGEIRGEKVRFRRSDGSCFTGLLSASIFDVKGEKYCLSVTRDIEDLLGATRELQRRERMLRDAQRIANVGCWELDILTDRLWWSDEVYRIFEIDKKGFGATYEAFLNIVHPEDRELVNDAYTKSLATKRPYAVEHRLLLPDGRIKWVEEQCETFFDEKGRPIRSIGTVLDITEKKQAYLTIKENEERYRYLFENSPTPLWEEDLSEMIRYLNEVVVPLAGGESEIERFLSDNPEYLEDCIRRVKVININKAALELHGASRKEELLEGLNKVFTEETYQVFLKQIVAISKGRDLFETESVLRTLEGEKKNVLVRFNLRRGGADAGSTHATYHAIVSTSDITPLKEVQKRLKQHSDYVETLLELDRAILEARGIEKVIDVSLGCVEKIIKGDRTSVALLHDGPEKIKIYAKGLLDDQYGQGLTIPLKHAFPNLEKLRDGIIVMGEDSDGSSPLNTEVCRELSQIGIKGFLSCPILARGKFYGSLNIGFRHERKLTHEEMEFLKGITATLAIALEKESLIERLKKSENALEKRVEERTRQLFEANRELEAFVHSVSHDLRGPLRAIKGFSKILKEDYFDLLDQEGRRILGVIVENAHLMGRFIEDLLRLSKVGRKELVKTKIDMKGMAWSIYHEVTTEEERNRIEFILGDLPDAEGDPALIRHLFSNLISNAVKFSQKRKRPEIEVGFMDEGGVVTYFVRDNGVGFDPCHRNEIFKIFKRFHPVEEFEGTGVGLSIVERIVKRHGGTIFATGKPGEGATFYFTL